MISVKHVTKKYGTSLIIDNVSFELKKGGLISIIGPNGAGKSTLLSIMARLLQPNSGVIKFDDLDVSKTYGRFLAQKLAILRQENHLTARLSVYDLVAFGRFPYSHGRLSAQDKSKIDEALAYLDLTKLSARFLDELSGGQRQRAFVAMVLCQDTDYLLLDEPLNNLDMKHARSMMRLLRKSALELGKTILLVLHDINFASVYSDHIIALKNGKLWKIGGVDEIMQSSVLQQIYDMQINVSVINNHKIALFYD